jgi:RimJ/RimL family protein N-acetyltransferase
MNPERGRLLAGTHVSIREMVESDAPLVVEWRNRPETQRWVYQWAPLTPEGQLAWFRGARERGDLLFVFETLAGEPIATAAVYDFDRRLGNAAQWGRLCGARIGAGPQSLLEGCYLVHRICFEILGLRRLSVAVVSENLVSLRLNRMLGYVEEGVQRRHWRHPSGVLEDVVLLGVFPEEFEAQRPVIEKLLYRGQPAPVLAPGQVESIRSALGKGRAEPAVGSASGSPDRRDGEAR